MPEVSRRSQTIITLVVVALGLAGVVASARLDLGSPSQPGPGFWPFLAAAVFLVCAVLVLATERSADDYEAVDRRTVPVLLGVVSLVAFAVILEALGVVLSGALLMLFWVRVLGGQGWRASLLTMVAAPIAAWAVFVLAFGVPLPAWPALVA